MTQASLFQPASELKPVQEFLIEEDLEHAWNIFLKIQELNNAKAVFQGEYEESIQPAKIKLKEHCDPIDAEIGNLTTAYERIIETHQKSGIFEENGFFLKEVSKPRGIFQNDLFFRNFLTQFKRALKKKIPSLFEIEEKNPGLLEKILTELADEKLKLSFTKEEAKKVLSEEDIISCCEMQGEFKYSVEPKGSTVKAKLRKERTGMVES